MALSKIQSESVNLADDFAGMHFGGTGSANQLDDYEEGTWTGTMIGTTANPSVALTETGTYIKVGALVYANITFTNVSTAGASGSVRINGLPFAANLTTASGNVMFNARFAMSTSASNITPYVPVSSTQISFYQSLNTSGWSEVTHSAGTGGYLWASIVYSTDS